MADILSIKSEIKSHFKDAAPDMIQKIDKELDILAKTEGIDSKNNLEEFYKIWKSYKGEIGHQNSINSWTAYYLGITNKQPDDEFLKFRRAFSRPSAPDIDLDFEANRRHEIVEYLKNKYGPDCVSNVGTFISEKMKMAVKDSAKALDIAYAFHKGKKERTTLNAAIADEISKTLDTNNAGMIHCVDENGKQIKVKDLEKAYKYVPAFRKYMDKYPDLFKYAKSIEGMIGDSSCHASGIVISDTPFRKIAPLKKNKKGIATQYVYDGDLESLGIIKFDVLAIATLDVVKDTCHLIEENYGIKIDIRKVPLQDKPTIDLYNSGKLYGVFQCESYGMQDTIKQMGIDSFENLVAAIALFRPGPMDFIPEYIARKKGYKKIDYLHPKIEKLASPYLSSTYGVVCYQEQVMQLCNVLAGFPLMDGYVVIKAIGKKKQYLLDKYRNQFIDGCIKNEIPKNLAEYYWDQVITPFAGYAFNRAHAVSYGLLSWETAFLKANYPDEYIDGYLNVFTNRALSSSANDWKHVQMMEREAERNMNIKILPRDLKYCDVFYKIERKKDTSKGITRTEIRPSVACKGLGYEPAKNLVLHAPYKDLEDMAMKTDTHLVTTESIGALIDAGFFRGREGQKKREDIVNQFAKIRKGVKTSRNQGIKSYEIDFK
jgi:DNA polymerase III subunit alpha